MALPALKQDLPQTQVSIINFRSEIVKRERTEKVDTTTELTPDQRAAMMQRLEFCRRVYALTESGRGQEEAVALVTSMAAEFPDLTDRGKGGKSALTLHNYRAWMRKLGKVRGGRPDWNNIQALADRYGKNLRGAYGNPEAWKQFFGFYLSEQRFSVSEAFRLMENYCRSNEITPVPTEKQVRYWLKTYSDQGAVMAARYGETWAENNVMSYIHRDWREVPVNYCWIGDHHVFDCYVRDFDKKAGKWKAVRPWISCWIDAKSLTVIGICIRVDEPDSVAILTALTNGIRSAGNTVPDILYHDNGKDFLKHGFGEPFIPKDSDQEHFICRELGIRTVRSLPYRARAKLVERYFKEFAQRFSKRHSHYLGSNPSERPEVSNYFLDNPEQLPSLHQFTEGFIKFLDSEYHTKTQRGKILDGMSPKEAWETRPEKRVWADPDLWFALLLPYTRNTPKVGRGGEVSIDGTEYRSDRLLPFMFKKIMVKLDVVNGRGPQAFTTDGKWICELETTISIPALAESEDDRKLISSEMRRQRLELKRVFGIADAMSNGLRRISAQEQLALQPFADPEIISIGSRRSVKGATHNFSHRIAAENKPVMLPAPADDQDIEREPTRVEKKQHKLRSFDGFMNGSRKENEDGKSDPAKMAEFGKFILTKGKERQDVDDQESGFGQRR